MEQSLLDSLPARAGVRGRAWQYPEIGLSQPRVRWSAPEDICEAGGALQLFVAAALNPAVRARDSLHLQPPSPPRECRLAG